MTEAGITVIGAGVVGLAVAECLSENYSPVFIIERNRSFGQETSSRNSEVIHAGIYYPEGSLKARLCVEGKELLYSFCRKWDIPFKNCGKLIVATSESELSILEGIIRTGSGNGVKDLTILNQQEVMEMEPNIFSAGAVYSPSTGIVDSHSLMKQLETNFINSGGNIAYCSEVIEISKISGGYKITLTDPYGKPYTYTTEAVVNSAGLSSDKVSEMAGINDPGLEIRFCKGEYFRLKPPKNRLISRLIYPVPHQNLEGIGIHITIDMGGGVKLGPDVTWLRENTPDYTVDASKQEAFFTSARKFLPFLEFNDITPEMAGIRPKIQKPGDPVKDFYIMEESKRGYPGFINLIGIESPGLTSCLSIARYVKGLLNGAGYFENR